MPDHPYSPSPQPATSPKISILVDRTAQYRVEPRVIFKFDPAGRYRQGVERTGRRGRTVAIDDFGELQFADILAIELRGSLGPGDVRDHRPQQEPKSLPSQHSIFQTGV